MIFLIIASNEIKPRAYDAKTIDKAGFSQGLVLNSDHTMIIRTTLSKWVMCSDLSFLLKMFYSKQRQGQFLSLPLFIFYTIMIKMGTF